VTGQLHAPAALPQRKSPASHWMGGWMEPIAGLDTVVKRKIPSSPPGIELRPSYRPARCQSLYRLSYPGDVLYTSRNICKQFVSNHCCVNVRKCEVTVLINKHTHIYIHITLMGPTQPPLQWVAGALSLGVKRPEREADHSPPSSAEVKECVELYLHSPIRLHGVVLS
jgi:hypothetical protein